jgi:hypothetical protein
MFKKISLLISCLTLFAYSGFTQCSLSDVAITDVTISGNTAFFNLSFKHTRNSGNKWVTIHFWDQADYPNYNYDVDGVPTSLSLDGEDPIGTIVINNSTVSATGTYTAAQAFVSSYQNDGTFAICTGPATTLTYNSVTKLYTITGLSLVLPSGTTVLEADVWSSQSQHNQQVHCFTKGIFPVVSGQLPSVSGNTNCTTLMATVTASNPNSIAASGTYLVYADANLNNVLDGSDPVIYTSSGITIPGNGIYNSDDISVPPANKYHDLYIIMDVSGFAIAAVAKVDGCDQVTPVTGMETFGATVDEKKVSFSWIAYSESNNSHFEIEKSYDGKEWFTLAVISSKYEDGNSGVPTTYTYTHDFSSVKTSGFNLWLLAGAIFIVLLLSVLITQLSQGIVILIRGSAVIIAIVGFASCRQEMPLSDDITAKQQTMFFRLKQVDKNMHYSYGETLTRKV